jgi:hypothetical protein
LKIFLPKGTKCLPVLDFSSVSKESEFILAPFSRIKITEVYKAPGPSSNKVGKVFLVGTYTGNGMESFYQAYKDNKVSELLSENTNKSVLAKNKKTEKENEHAWDDKTITHEEMQKLASNTKVKVKM